MLSTRFLPASIPETQGIPSSAIATFIQEIESRALNLHSLMLVRHGHVVAAGWWAPYGRRHPHMLFSLSKSFTSTAVGLAVAEGLLSVDDPVISFFPEQAPAEIGEHLAAMQVRHLLTMSTGHAEDSGSRLRECADGDWVRAILQLPVEYEPGTHFLYNNGASYLLSAIVQSVTDETVLDYLRPRLFEPLGIQHPTWETCPRGINTGGWGLSVRTEDIAHFGQLYLQKGMWNDRRILPEEWVNEATSRRVANGDAADSDWTQGYGYQFWRCRYGAYRGDGAFGQFCLVMPEQDAVLATTAGTGDMQGVLDLVWEHLLPAMADGPLPEDSVAADALRDRLSGLALPMPSGEGSSPVAAQVSGRRYHFAPDSPLRWVRFEFAEGSGSAITLCNDRGEHRIDCGYEKWVRGFTTFDVPSPQPIASAGAWSDRDTYTVCSCLYETPFVTTGTFRFQGDELTATFVRNVSFGPTENEPLMGRAE
ncbi:MAG: serine hydrolase domain-containing protein [Anaerolineae bacterium]|jgi:CubicO group peptidase (beta-lactamase class C family)